MKHKYTHHEIALLNSKAGLRSLFMNKKLHFKKSIAEAAHVKKLRELQEELIKVQSWVIENRQKVVILFEGRDAAGKGGAIRRITEYINPRHFKIVALDIPTDDEKDQWFFQRYINQLPKPGEIVFFDRSWYNRAIVEPVNGFCTQKEYKIFMTQVNELERMLIQSGTYLIKFYFSISKDEQAKRFDEIRNDPLKRWKLTPVDERAQELWPDYTRYKEEMFRVTDTKYSPWITIDANKKSFARTTAIKKILKLIPYKD